MDQNQTLIAQRYPSRGKSEQSLLQPRNLPWTLLGADVRGTFHGVAASKLPGGTALEPPPLSPFSVLRTPLGQRQITREPLSLQTWKYPPLSLAWFIFCYCSVLNQLPGWSEEPQQPPELSREVGAVGPFPLGCSDVVQLVRSSCETL